MVIKPYIIERNHIMIRVTEAQAIGTLKGILQMDSKLVDKMTKVEIGVTLLEKSNGTMCLKGTREATNISFAPPTTQSTYKEAELMVGTLARFVGKDGLKYECGVYCKKVVIKKETEGKKETEKK